MAVRQASVVITLRVMSSRSQALLGNARTRSSASPIDESAWRDQLPLTKQSFGEFRSQAGAWERGTPIGVPERHGGRSLQSRFGWLGEKLLDGGADLLVGEWPAVAGGIASVEALVELALAVVDEHGGD